MIYIKEIIKATDETIGEIVRSEINKLGRDADLNHIDVSGVSKMIILFYNSSFNGDISGWNVGNVRNMRSLFFSSKFNGDISNWNVMNVQDMTEMFDGSPLEGREPWWYVLSPLFGSPHLLWDSLDFRWIDFNEKIIYREKLIKTLKRGYNREWNGKLPEVWGFIYK